MRSKSQHKSYLLFIFFFGVRFLFHLLPKKKGNRCLFTEGNSTGTLVIGTKLRLNERNDLKLVL